MMVSDPGSKNETRKGRPPKSAREQKAEIREIKRVLKMFKGNASRAARELDLPRRTFYHRCRKYDINPNSFRPTGWEYERPDDYSGPGGVASA